MAFGARGRLALALAAAGAPSAAMWAAASLAAPEPVSLALRLGLELGSASLDGFLTAAQVACFVQLLRDPSRARLAGPLAR